MLKFRTKNRNLKFTTTDGKVKTLTIKPPPLRVRNAMIAYNNKLRELLGLPPQKKQNREDMK